MANTDIAWRLLNAAITQAKAQLEAAGIAYSETDGYRPRVGGLFASASMERWLDDGELWLAHCEVKIDHEDEASVITRFSDQVVAAMLRQPGPSAPPLPPPPPRSLDRDNHCHHVAAVPDEQIVGSDAWRARHKG